MTFASGSTSTSTVGLAIWIRHSSGQKVVSRRNSVSMVMKYGLGQLFAGGGQIGSGFDHINSFAEKRSVKPSFPFRKDMSIR